MINFLDGPAEGVTLALRRAPLLLRVVRSQRGAWDALDQLEDEAQPKESIFVYRLEGPTSWYHVCRRPRSQSGMYMIASYRVLPEQPAEEHLRTTKAWHVWADANAARLIEEIKRQPAIFQEPKTP
jgi:hypothetical protein